MKNLIIFIILLLSIPSITQTSNDVFIVVKSWTLFKDKFNNDKIAIVNDTLYLDELEGKGFKLDTTKVVFQYIANNQGNVVDMRGYLIELSQRPQAGTLTDKVIDYQNFDTLWLFDEWYYELKQENVLIIKSFDWIE